ncbi:uncharacterized protein LOC126811696 [Patella vulgata]|uniref:uncharacterized protein LOC126811696 n=1 Tax=Patella vulgata TaxID=6465 RepID=UPI00217FEF5A|nr:uncharacterized protein LOC126811696 [Patella vulgata]
MEPNMEDELPLGRVPDPVAFEQSIRKLMNLGFRSESNKTLDESSEICSARKQSTSLLKTPCLRKSRTEKTLIQESRLQQLRHPSAPVVSQHPEIFQTTITRLPRRMDSFVLNYKSASTPSIAKVEERALFEEVKRRVAKRKKKKYVPTIRMRRELPPPNSNVLCFNFYNGDFSHRDVKNMIESQSETKILNLKFDPIYVHMGGSCSQYKSMWVFTVNNMSARANLLYYGLRFKDENIRVRLYDDIMREEHNAYKLYKEVENEKLKTQPQSDHVEKHTKPVPVPATPIPAGLLTASFVSSPEHPQSEMKVKKSKTRKGHRDKQISFYIH